MQGMGKACSTVEWGDPGSQGHGCEVQSASMAPLTFVWFQAGQFLLVHASESMPVPTVRGYLE